MKPSPKPYAPKTDRTHLDKRATSIIATAPTDEDTDELLTTSQLAIWLGVSRQWLEIGRLSAGDTRPPFVRIAPQTIRYRRDDVVAWLEARTHRSTQEYHRASKKCE